MTKLKELLFRIGLRKKCPICNSQLLEMGFAKDFVQYYKCSNEHCNWGKEIHSVRERTNRLTFFPRSSEKVSNIPNEGVLGSLVVHSSKISTPSSIIQSEKTS